MKRAIGWKKSQRKAVNKRKKENIQNSKLFSKWDAADNDVDNGEVGYDFMNLLNFSNNTLSIDYYKL